MIDYLEKVKRLDNIGYLDGPLGSRQALLVEKNRGTQFEKFHQEMLWHYFSGIMYSRKLYELLKELPPRKAFNAADKYVKELENEKV